MKDDRPRRRRNQRRDIQRFQPYAGSKHLAVQLGCGDVIDSIRVTHDKITAVHRGISLSSSFTLLDPADLKRLSEIGENVQAEFFWRQIHQLLLLVPRSSIESACSLIEGLSWAIGTANELTFALTLRAFIEHAAAVEFIRSGIADDFSRITTTIWPAFTSGAFPAITNKDVAIHDELLCFAVGRQNGPLGEEIPEAAATPSRWGRFYADLYRRTSELPSQYKSREVRDYIYPLRGIEGRRHFRAVYNRLCEFCHPNAASRLLDFQVERSKSGKHEVFERADTFVSIAFTELFELAKGIVPAGCEMVVGGIEQFAGCLMPMSAIDERQAGSEPPPIGSITAVDEHGRIVHVMPDQIDCTPDPSRMLPLTAEQERRLRKVHDGLRELTGSTLAEWLDGFRMEGVFADEEIKIYERVLEVYGQEIAERNATEPRDRTLVYSAVLHSTDALSPDHLVSKIPALKSLPNIERLFLRVRAPQ